MKGRNMQYDKEQLLGAVKDYIELMKKSGLGYLRVKSEGFEIELGEKPRMPQMPPMPVMPPNGMTQGIMTAGQQQSGAPVASAQQQVHKGIAVRSPIIGTFYASPSPGKPPYVSVGQQVHKGDVLFIIESMKLMNEVTSEFDGIVSEILIKDGDTVEYDQPILMIV